jgi:outer membrane protein TolC
MKKLLLLLLLTTSLFSSVGIEEAWRVIEDKNSALAAAKEDIAAAQHKRSSVKSMYLPNISLSASYTHLDKVVDFDTSKVAELMAFYGITLFPSSVDLSKEDIFLADLQLMWPLYVGGKIDAAQDLYSAKVDEAKAMLAMQKDKTFLKLIKYYYGVVVAESLYKTRSDALKALQLHYENAKKLYNEGQIAKVELLNAQVKRDAAEIEKEKAADRVNLTKRALGLLIGSKATLASPLFVYESRENLRDFQEQLHNKSATLSLFDAKKREANSLITVKEAAFKPDVIGFADYNLYKDDSLMMESMPNWSAGVLVKFDILAREDRTEELEIAKLTNSKVLLLKKEALQNLEILLQKSYDEMHSAYKEFHALNSSLALAQENYRLRSLSFKEGVATSSDVVDAELFLESVKTKRANAAYTFVQRLAELLILSGERERFFEILKSSEIELLEQQ